MKQITIPHPDTAAPWPRCTSQLLGAVGRVYQHPQLGLVFVSSSRLGQLPDGQLAVRVVGFVIRDYQLASVPGYVITAPTDGFSLKEGLHFASE